MLNPGQMLGNFKVLKKLGEGGMGEVYLAEDQKLHRKVALKTLPSDLFGDVERQKRFQREAQTAAQIAHPHVMAIYDIGAAPEPGSGHEINYIIMELVEGVPVLDYLRKRPNDMAAVVRLAEKIASGLAAAHKLSIVHRDIKAANVSVNEDGEPKILDFGLAKPLDPFQWGDKGEQTDSITDQLTKVGNIVGTVSYMSPEQARGETVDTRSDIFSFGVLLYRMATGSLPFEGTTPVSTLAKILEAKPESPRLRNENVPADLERIIVKCLQKDSQDRYQDTRDLVVDLRNLRRQYESGPSETISAVHEISGAAPKGRQGSRLAGTKKAALILLGLIILAAALRQLFVASGSDGKSAVQAGENSLAILSFENMTDDSTLNWLETGLPEILITDLSESQALNVISRQRMIDYLNREAKRESEDYSQAELRDAARALGAVNVLSGALYKLGHTIRFDARLEETATGKIILSEKVVGEDPFALVDSLTDKIVAKLDLTIPTASHVNVSELITPSTEAYRVYQEGMELFGLELYDEAVEKFSRALAIDPGFALAYMRIGMTRAFQGRPQEAARHLALAQENKGRLPHRERSLLEIYAGFWQEMKFDDAIVRLESFVNTYPDDKEARTVYALVLAQLWSDTLRAFAHLDTVLKTDPAFQIALAFYSQIYKDFGNLDNAIEYAERIRHFHPDSPESYTRLSDLYEQQMKYGAAIEELESMLTRFPDNAEALLDLATLYIRKRDFSRSRQYLEQVAEKHSDDPYRMVDYFQNLANLSYWSGQFKSGMDSYFKALEQAKLTGDSAIISSALETISIYYYRFGMPDSALYFSRESFRWANAFQRLDYPITLVAIDTSFIREAQPIFDTALEDFKSRTPSNLWPIATAVEKIFDAHCRLDTASLIDAYEQLTKAQTERTATGNVRESGYLKVLSGQYEDGRQILQRFVVGPEEVTSAYHYLYSSYLLGIANEGLGNTREAVRNYEEMLKYWGNPEVELKEIKDARARLAKLTS